MQKARFSVLFVAVACVAGTASAMPPRAVPGAAKLAAPLAAPLEVPVGGAAWRCAAAGCLGPSDWYSRRDDVEPLIQGCRDLARAVGPLRAYAYGGRLLSAADVTECNRAAARRHRLGVRG